MNAALETGIAAAQRAADHADRTHPDHAWSKIAWVRFLEFVLEVIARERTLSGGRARFTTEEFRAWAALRSLPAPPDPRAFGNITRKAHLRRIIAKTGDTTRAGAQAHGREVRLWEIL